MISCPKWQRKPQPQSSHRQYVFSLPNMMHIYFRNERQLLKRLFAIAELATPSLSASANGIKVGLRSRLASLVIWSRQTHWRYLVELLNFPPQGVTQPGECGETRKYFPRKLP
jgi:hypothetical protein